MNKSTYRKQKNRDCTMDGTIPMEYKYLLSDDVHACDRYKLSRDAKYMRERASAGASLQMARPVGMRVCITP